MLKASKILFLFLLFSSGLAQAQSKGMKPVGGNAPSGTERRLALVIGNKDYQNVSKLNNPLNDADEMAAALQQLGFEVILRKNLTQNLSPCKGAVAANSAAVGHVSPPIEKSNKINNGH